jgi:hypothetical protein
MAKRNIQAEMKNVLQELEAEEGMEATYSGDVDMPDNVVLIEEDYEDYSDEEVDMFLENVNFEESKNSMSFDEMMPKIVEPVGIPYQRKEKIVTPHFLILRENVKQSPSVCTYRDCMYDAAQAIGFKNWEKIPNGKKKIALAALEKHTEVKHKYVDSDIIDEAQIPTHWLSPTTL